MTVEAHHRVRILNGHIGDIPIVIVVDVVVVELDVLQAFIIRVLDFCDANHEYSSLQCKVFCSSGGPTSFFVRRIERSTFLEWKFAGVGSRVW
jgi:hypothetical protein